MRIIARTMIAFALLAVVAPALSQEIIVTPQQVTIIKETQTIVRRIWINREMPAEGPDSPDPTFNGYSVGHWEGDTLVVNSKGISSFGIIDQLGTPHSDELKVTERIRKINDGKNLEDTMTFDDPVAYTRPWTAKIYQNWDNGHRISEYVCEENNRNASDAEGHTSVR